MRKRISFRSNSRRWTSAPGRDRARRGASPVGRPGRAADCSQGSADEKMACLNQKVGISRPSSPS